MPLTRPALTACAAFVALGTPFLWVVSFFESHEERAALKTVESTASLAARKLESFVEVRLRSLHSFAQFLPKSELDAALFEESATRMYSALPGMQAINWVSAEGIITWVHPQAGNVDAQGRSLVDHPLASGPFERARSRRTTEITPPLSLFQGKAGFACYIPVEGKSEHGESRLLGLVNGVFTMDQLVDVALEPELLVDFQVEIFDGETRLYPSTELTELAGWDDSASSLHAVNTVPVHSRTWDLHLRPTADSWLAHQSSVYGVVRISGLLFLGAISALIYVVLGRRKMARDAQSVQERMRRSLHEAQKMEAVGRLAGCVAHDFNNLLTTIVGNSSLIESNKMLAQSDRTHIDQVLAACDRATGLTAQLLAFSTHDSVERKQIEVCAEFRLLLPLLRAMTPEGIDLEYHCACSDAWIAWAPSQLAQVMTNLISNAVDAQEGPGVIRLTIAQEPDSEQLVIHLVDEGTGMSEETLSRARQPFFSTKGAGRGTGLGLVSVERILAERRCRLNIESELGQGTSVTIHVPLIESPATTASSEHASAANAKPLRILVVEDKQAVREVTESLLCDLGHEPLATASPHQALRAIDADTGFDLIVTDLQMPGMTGMQLTRAIRERGITVPVILCSGYAENIRPEQLAELGMSYLTKPFGREELARAIATCGFSTTPHLRRVPSASA